MVCTTVLNEHELDVPTSDEMVNWLLKTVKDSTEKNWQVVVERTYPKKRWFRPDERCSYFSLYLEVGGVLPFQVISGVNTAQDVKNYLSGILTGLGCKDTD